MAKPIEVGQVWEDRLIKRKVKVLVADPDVVSLEVLDEQVGDRFIRHYVGNFRAIFTPVPDSVEIRYRRHGALTWKFRLVARENAEACRANLKRLGMEVK